jgi:GAF domain-containing protein
MSALSRGEPDHLSFLHRTSRIVSSGLNLQDMLREMVDLVVRVTSCDACLVYLPDASTGEVVLAASQLPHASEIGKLRMKVGEGVAGWVAQHKSVVALPRRASADPRFKKFSTLVEDTFEALVSAPLVTGGEVIGVLNVHHREPHQHTAEEIGILTFLGEQMGVAIARARLAAENVRLQAVAEEVRRRLEDRTIIERAKGILQEKFQLSEAQAYLRLRNESRRLRRPMRDLAQAILLSEGLDPAQIPAPPPAESV